MYRTRDFKAALLGSVGIMALAAGPAMAGELEDLKSKVNQQDDVIKQLQTRLDQIEKQKSDGDDSDVADTQVEVKTAPSDAVVGGDYPGSFKLPGSDTSVGIHGFVQADFIYDFNQQLGDTFQSSKIAPRNSAAQSQGHQFRFSARQTRLAVETRTPTDYGPMRTLIAMDFLGAGAGPGLLGGGGGGFASAGFGNAFVTNSYLMRIRQAFGEFMGFRAGQDYSNFTDVDALPQLFDGFGPAGETKIRQPQLRYTREFPNMFMGNWVFSVSAENPQSDFTSSATPLGSAGTAFTAGSYGAASFSNIGGSGYVLPGHEQIPDFTAAAKFSTAWGYLKVAGLIREIGVDTGSSFTMTNISSAGVIATATVPRQKAEVFGGGGVLSGVLNIGALLPFLGKDQAGFNGYYGSGMGRYLNYAGNVNDGAALKNFGLQTDRLVTNPAEGGFVWYQHNWTDMLRSNVVFGMQHLHWSRTTPLSTGQVDTIETFHANIMWSPVRPVTLGLEFMYASKEFRDTRGVTAISASALAGNSNAHDARLQASMQILF